MSTVETEHVLVVPTASFRELGYFQGVSTDVDRYLPHLLAADRVTYRPRGEMERDPNFKQLIPYVIFQHDSPTGDPWLFAYTRGKGQGETRLHAKCSIGVGGHISREDASRAGTNPYQEGMQRELDEEVEIRTSYRDRLVGMLNDDETDVGKVHLGIVHLFHLETPDVLPREQAMHDAGFRRLDELRAMRDQMESWSRICLDAIFGDR